MQVDKKRSWMIVKRKKLGLSQSKLSELTGLSRRSIGFYELGIRSPRVENAKIIAKIIDVDWTKFYE